jgi:hypothetical protein
MEEVDKMISPVTKSETKAVSPKKFPFPSKASLKNRWLIISTVLVILAVGLIALFLLVPSATLTLSLKEQNKEVSKELVADTSLKTLDQKAEKIPLMTKEVTKEGSDQMDASGKKTVGTFAKGRVTITNQDTTSEKNFVAGTILTPETSDSSISFKLDEDKTIEKATPGPNGQKSVGANVTALSPGEKGNLPANTVFKVGTSPDYLVYATNDVAFTGGSTKQITVASADDRNTLRAKIIDDLKQQSEEELSKSTSGSLAVKDSEETSVITETYTPNSLETETSSLKATIKIQSKIYLVKKDDLKTLLLSKLKESQGNFKVNEDNLIVSAEYINKESSNSLNIRGKLKASLIPKVDEVEIKNNLKGKSFDQVASYLSGLKEVTSFKVELAPSLFRILRIMPFLGSKIKITYN